MKEQLETVYPAQTIYLWTVMKPAKRLLGIAAERYQQGEEKDSDNENDRNNGLRINKEMTMKEKRFSFFAHPQEKKAESLPTFGTLPFARHTSQRFAKDKGTNLLTQFYWNILFNKTENE